MSLRPAATVIVVDDAGQVLLVQRSKDIKFFGGAYAFPGGRVEASDVPASAIGDDFWAPFAHPPAGSDFCADRARLFVAYEQAARREVEEESGLRITTRLLPWARWITPEPEPRRYDTLFFVARAAVGEVRVDGSETIAHRWLTPRQALALAKTGEIILPPPTFVTLTELDTYGGWSTLEQLVATHGTPEIFPSIVPESDKLWLVLPPIARGYPAGMPTRAEIALTSDGVRAIFPG